MQNYIVDKQKLLYINCKHQTCVEKLEEYKESQEQLIKQLSEYISKNYKIPLKDLLDLYNTLKLLKNNEITLNTFTSYIKHKANGDIAFIDIAINTYKTDPVDAILKYAIKLVYKNL